MASWLVSKVLPGLITAAVVSTANWLSHRKTRRHVTRTADRQTAELSAKREPGGDA